MKLSIPAVIFIVMFIFMALYPGFDDPDFYWHVKTGEYIVKHVEATGSLPRYDVFTYTSYGNQWVLSEWLSQVIFYGIYKVAGLSGVGVFVASIYVMCWLVNYLTCRDILRDEGKSAIVTLMFCAFIGWVAPRPHLFTFLFFSLLVRQLFLFKYFRCERGLLFVPIMMLFWANLHGGFFIGLVLMFLFIVSEWGKWLWLGAKDNDVLVRMKKISALVFFAMLATAVNPDGFYYWLYPYRAIVMSGDAEFINEWQSPNFHFFVFQYFLSIVFAFFLNMVYSAKKPDLTEISVPLIFVAGAFFSVRNLPLAALAMSPFFAVFFNDLNVSDALLSGKKWLAKGGEGDGVVPVRVWNLLAEGNKQVGGAENTINWIMLVASLLFIVALYPSRKASNEKAMLTLLPVRAANFIVDNQISGRMFNTYHFGGYLMYKLYPWQRVFIYGRTDIYQKGFMGGYIDIYHGGEKWKSLFDKKNIDYVVCESSAPIRQLLLNGGEFKLVFSDGVHSVLLRDVDKYRKLIDKYSKNA